MHTKTRSDGRASMRLGRSQLHHYDHERTCSGAYDRFSGETHEMIAAQASPSFPTLAVPMMFQLGISYLSSRHSCRGFFEELPLLISWANTSIAPFEETKNVP